MVLDLIVLGVAIGADPIPLVAYMVILPSKRGVLKGAMFLLGWFVSMAVVVAITVSATANDPPKSNTAPSLAALAAKIAIGTALIVIAVRRRRGAGKPKKPKNPPKWQASVDSMSPWYALALGPLTQPWGLLAAGAATVVDAKVSSAASFIALLLFCLLASSTYLTLELHAVFWPQRSDELLAAIRTWISQHSDQVIAIGALALGLWLVAQSIYFIVS
jgi:hypothetical protein